MLRYQSGLRLLLVGGAAAARAREARVVGLAAVKAVEGDEVAVVAVGVVVGVEASVAAVVAPVGVVAAAVMAVGVEPFRGSGGGQRVRCQYVIRTGDRAGQTCRKVGHTQYRYFSRLEHAWREEFGDVAELPRWLELLRNDVDIFALNYDAILAGMYALTVSAEGDCYLCVLPNPGIEAAALGASESTTVTPLRAPVAVSLADPSGGPVLARSSTVLPCPAVPSGSLSGLYLPSFSTNLVSTAALQDSMVTTTTPGGQRVSICTCARTGCHLATFTRRPGSSLYTLTTEPTQVAASSQASASGQIAAPCSCRLLSHQTLLWRHHLGHPSLPRLRGMHSRLLFSGLPSHPPPPPPLFLAPGPPPVAPLPPHGPAPSSVSQVDPLPLAEPVKVTVNSGAARGVASGGAEPAGAEPGGDESEGAERVGAESEGAEPRGAELEGTESGGAEPEDTESGGAEPRGIASVGGPTDAFPRQSRRREPLSLLQLREWFARRTRLRSGATGAGGPAARGTGAGGAGATSPRGAGGTAGAGGARTGGTGGAGAAGPGGATTGGTGAAGASGAAGAGGARGAGAGGAGAGGIGAGDAGAGDAVAGGTGVGGTRAGGVGAGDP
ncbi:unnamed protein product [Closterium sp. NIES-54]